MARVELIMPKMGESITEATILKWLKKPGDKIEQDESVLEVATDKVDTEVPSTHAGILKEILAKGHPLVLVNDGDIGGIIGLHFQEELKVEKAIISIDGIALSDFDFIDVGALIPSSGAVPVVIKSLIFPASPEQ